MVAERRRERQADMTEADDRNAHEMVPETTSGTRQRLPAPAFRRQWARNSIADWAMRAQPLPCQTP